jgi:hypothetical protein
MLVYIIMLIKLLIVFFTCLIGYQLFTFAFKNGSDLVEGLENKKANDEYKDYNTDDPNNPNSALILAQQNAGNIEVLNGRVTKLDGVKDRVDTLDQITGSMQTQIDALVQQQADFATDLVGDTPVEVTGLDEDEEGEEDEEEEQ